MHDILEIKNVKDKTPQILRIMEYMTITYSIYKK